MAKNTGKNSPKHERCSFCGRGRDSVKVLFQGADGSNICNDCIEMGYKSLASSELTSKEVKKGAKSSNYSAENILKPQQIHDF